MIRFAPLFFLLVPVAACTSPDASDGARAAGEHGERIAIRFDQSDPERLIRYYFGSYASAEGADPFEAGMVVREEAGYAVDVAAFERAAGPGATAALRSAAGGPGGTDALDWDEMKSFVAATYYAARDWPETLGALREAHGWSAADTAWFRVDATGSMTTARRNVYVSKAALRAALARYTEAGERLLYPAGTLFVGEHAGAGQSVVEVTAMRKRADGFWDYATYGTDERLAAATLAAPKALDTPTQCVGCHFGSRAFEPEKSFPREARPGPHGPRGVHADPAIRRIVQETGLAEHFREHTKRSDTVLGLYNTLFVAHLLRQRTLGTLAPGDARLLEGLDL